MIISISEFPAEDKYSQIKSALDYCRLHPGTTLIIPPGDYKISSNKGKELIHDVLTGKYGNDPEKHVFKHGFTYDIGLDLSGLHEVTIKGYGARLLFDGWLEAISVVNSSHVKIEGLTIDYIRKAYSYGEIIHVDPPYFDVKFFDKYEITEKTPSCRMYVYSEEAKKLTACMYPAETKNLLEPQVLRFKSERPIDSDLLNQKIVCWHMFHFRPAVLINESKHITLDSITIHSQPGMGIVGHRSDHIDIRGIRIIPEAGEPLSVNTDAMHFTSCKGTISVKNSQFSNHGDDVINVHNYYYNILSAEGTTYQTMTTPNTHAAIMDYPDSGETMELVDRRSLKIIDVYQVLDSKRDEASWTNQLTLDRLLPADYENYYLLNATRFPSLELINCHTSHNLARAVLIKTRNVLVEDCTFIASTSTAIHIAAEGNWMEGGTTENIRIINNTFLGCGYMNQFNRASAVCINIVAENPNEIGLHKNVNIEGNTIIGNGDEIGIYIGNSDHVRLKNNKFSSCTEPIVIENSLDVQTDINIARYDNE
jgi:parallel beta-helix repeat protein